MRERKRGRENSKTVRLMSDCLRANVAYCEFIEWGILQYFCFALFLRSKNMIHSKYFHCVCVCLCVCVCVCVIGRCVSFICFVSFCCLFCRKGGNLFFIFENYVTIKAVEL